MRNKKIIVTMPVFNEKDVIEEVVRKNYNYIKKFPKGELVVSEDGSTDGTKEILKKLKKELNFILHTSSSRKGAVQGQKDALRYALDARADIILLTDSDNQHDPEDFNLLLKELKRSDMVIGWKKPRNDPYWRKYGSKVWNFYIRILFGIGLHDLNCGFRVMTRQCLLEIYTEANKFQECYPTELSIRAHYKGFELAEVPIKHFMRGDKPKAWDPKKIPKMALVLLFKSLALRKALLLRKKRDVKQMDRTYEKYYDEGSSFRDNWFGPITSAYIIPKYFKLLDSFIRTPNKKLSILELGAGDGEVTDLIRKRRSNWKILPTEPIKSGVEALIKKGYKNAKIVDAMKIPFNDNSFDYVIAFDVMHHVEKPEKMGHEMLRVARKGAFLIEANRVAIVRQLLEKTKVYRQAGEFSYYPIEYKSFFSVSKLKSIKITPFQFIPPKLSNISLPATIFISELVAKIPILRWQCSGVAIEVIKK